MRLQKSRQGGKEGCICRTSVRATAVPGAPTAFKPVPRVRRLALRGRVSRRRHVVPDRKVRYDPEPASDFETALVAFLLYVYWIFCFLITASKTSIFWNAITWVREWQRRFCDPDYDHWAKVSKERMLQPTKYYQ